MDGRWKEVRTILRDRWGRSISGAEEPLHERYDASSPRWAVNPWSCRPANWRGNLRTSKNDRPRYQCALRGAASEPGAAIGVWMGAQIASELFTTAITEAEFLLGWPYCHLAAGVPIEAAASPMSGVLFARRGLPSTATSKRTQKFGRPSRRSPIGQADGQIAAIAPLGAAVATRDIMGFADCGSTSSIPGLPEAHHLSRWTRMPGWPSMSMKKLPSIARLITAVEPAWGRGRARIVDLTPDRPVLQTQHPLAVGVVERGGDGLGHLVDLVWLFARSKMASDGSAKPNAWRRTARRCSRSRRPGRPCPRPPPWRSTALS